MCFSNGFLLITKKENSLYVIVEVGENSKECKEEKKNPFLISLLPRNTMLKDIFV